MGASVRHLLPGEKMVSAIHVLAAIAVVVNGQPAGDKPLEECCDMKTVGGMTYTLSGQMNTKMYNCLNDCVYQMEGRPEAKFCFAMGDQKVECNDDEVRLISRRLGHHFRGAGPVHYPTANATIGAASEKNAPVTCVRQRPDRVVGRVALG